MIFINIKISNQNLQHEKIQEPLHKLYARQQVHHTTETWCDVSALSCTLTFPDWP